MNTPNFEWHQLDPHQEDLWTSDPQQPNEDAAIPARQRQERATHHKMYELIIGIALLYSFVGLLIWHQTEQRIADLEAEIALLHGTAGQTSVANSLAKIEVALQNPAIKPQWRALAEIIEVHVHLAYGQELNANLRQRLTQSAADIEAYSLQRTLVPAGQAQWRAELAMHAPSYQQPNPQYAVANLLIEFIRAEYGLEQLSALLAAFTHHETWETLVPALFAMSASAFEAKWHAYVQKH